MRSGLLLDTHVLLAIGDDSSDLLAGPVGRALAETATAKFASIASLWEVAIKHRLGKLPLPCPIGQWPSLLRSGGIELLPIDEADVIVEVDPLPTTRDPFDRLLLAVCQNRGLALLTIDRSLVDHPLSYTQARA